jgi:SAM-dependent methyltransferase
MQTNIYKTIVEACETSLEAHGDTFRGVGWTKKKEYADLRYKVMLEGIKNTFHKPLTLLDFGCGAAHLYEYIQSAGISGINYSGLDLSTKFLELCRRKFPSLEFHHIDLLQPGTSIPQYDFIVLNGVFNFKGEMSFEVMKQYFQDLLLRVWPFARQGMAFNVMSKYLDWERDDLFHLGFHDVAQFLDLRISRHFTIRHDYGLYEYTVYVYRESEVQMSAA